MEAIERITSQEAQTYVQMPGGGHRPLTVRVWNATVANLSLMALGSSAPEILLSVIEICGNSFYSGELGPSTIVGSAAFNLMVITAVCVIALPDGEVRTLKQLNVFYITSAYSLWAYIWLLLIVVVITPEFIDVWEAALTVVFLVLLVAKAYIADKYSTDTTGKPRIKGASLDKQEAIEAIKAAIAEALQERPTTQPKPRAKKAASGKAAKTKAVTRAKKVPAAKKSND